VSAEIPSPRSPASTARADALRAATFTAAATLDGVVRRRAEETSRPALIALGLLATGAAVALAHLAGTDMPAGLGGGQSQLLPSLVTRAISRKSPAEL
jgi:hypothetical protein